MISKSSHVYLVLGRPYYTYLQHCGVLVFCNILVYVHCTYIYKTVDPMFIEKPSDIYIQNCGANVYRKTLWYFISDFYSTTKHEIIQIKKITIYYVVWTRLTRVSCFNW